jgi:hypothetical protein
VLSFQRMCSNALIDVVHGSESAVATSSQYSGERVASRVGDGGFAHSPHRKLRWECETKRTGPYASKDTEKRHAHAFLPGGLPRGPRPRKPPRVYGVHRPDTSGSQTAQRSATARWRYSQKAAQRPSGVRAARYNHMTSEIQKLTTASSQSAGTPSVTKVVTVRRDSLLRIALAPASECNLRFGQEDSGAGYPTRPMPETFSRLLANSGRLRRGRR